MLFANTAKEITLIYYSKKPIGSKILAYAQIENIPIHEIDLVYITLSTSHWAEIATRLVIPVRELINTEDPDYMQKFGPMDSLSDDDWLTLLVHNPDVLRAPIVMKGDKVVVMNNPQDMLRFV